MSLNISGATSGYDVSGMQSLINEVKITIIPAVAKSIRDSVQSTRETISSVWVGASAEAFKEKMHNDTETLCNTLDKMAEELENELKTVGVNVEDYDNALAEKIKNWN